jgi:hypothetical protein
VIVVPQSLASTASDLAGLGSTINAANTAAAVQTTSVAAAAQDEVSGAIAELFSAHAQEFQALSAQAAGFHDQFVRAMNSGAAAYATAEAANVTPLQSLEQVVGQELQALDSTIDRQLNIAAIEILEDGYFDIIVDIAHEPQDLIRNSAISIATGAINNTAGTGVQRIFGTDSALNGVLPGISGQSENGGQTGGLEGVFDELDRDVSQPRFPTTLFDLSVSGVSALVADAETGT